MTSISSLLLAGTALVAVNALVAPASAANGDPIVVAQANPKADADTKKSDSKAQAKPPKETPATQDRRNARPQRDVQDRKAGPKQDVRKPVAAESKPAAAEPQPSASQVTPSAAKPAADNKRDDKAAQTPAADKNNRQTEKKADDKSNARQVNQKRDDKATDQKRDDKDNARNADQRRNQPAANERAASDNRPAADKKPRDASEFIRRDNNSRRVTIDDLRKERRETREGNRTVIREGDRTIVREGNRTIIRHDEGDRFAIGARGVQVSRSGGETRTVVERSNGERIVTITDANGRLVRRVRQDARGREIVIIDNRAAVRGPVFVMLPPPVIRIPRERYIVELRAAPPPVIYETLVAAPVEPIATRYSLEQVRYSAPLRDRMPRVDLDINFDTGSWQLTPDQIDKLAAIAEGLNKAIAANPQEVFLIEGYTDAVGSEDDNLSLSDRRAEAVAVALTEQFQVPPENLVTQGYGEQNLKVDTQAAEPANRRVSVRRVTPLLAQGPDTTGGGQPQ
jgi:outer membrane protein OmpA-like peptidoglycan-associated protein